MSDTDIPTVVRWLQQNGGTLTKLNLEDNYFTAKGLEQLRDTLVKQRNLTSLIMPKSVSLLQGQWQQLEKVLSDNKEIDALRKQTVVDLGPLAKTEKFTLNNVKQLVSAYRISIYLKACQYPDERLSRELHQQCEAQIERSLKSISQLGVVDLPMIYEGRDYCWDWDEILKYASGLDSKYSMLEPKPRPNSTSSLTMFSPRALPVSDERKSFWLVLYRLHSQFLGMQKGLIKPKDPIFFVACLHNAESEGVLAKFLYRCFSETKDSAGNHALDAALQYFHSDVHHAFWELMFGVSAKGAELKPPLFEVLQKFSNISELQNDAKLQNGENILRALQQFRTDLNNQKGLFSDPYKEHIALLDIYIKKLQALLNEVPKLAVKTDSSAAISASSTSSSSSTVSTSMSSSTSTFACSAASLTNRS